MKIKTAEDIIKSYSQDGWIWQDDALAAMKEYAEIVNNKAEPLSETCLNNEEGVCVLGVRGCKLCNSKKTVLNDTH